VFFCPQCGARAPLAEIHGNSIEWLARSGVPTPSFAPARVVSTDPTCHITSAVGSGRMRPAFLPGGMVPENSWRIPQERGHEQWFGVALRIAPAAAIIDETVAQTDPSDTGA
jgi:hypothetical protein